MQALHLTFTPETLPRIFFFFALKQKALYMSVTLQTDYDYMVFPSKCIHLNFKLNIFRSCKNSWSLKGEALYLLFYPFGSSALLCPHSHLRYP